MKESADLAFPFFRDPVREFYSALRSDLFRILRYDVDRINKEGIERAEGQLNSLMTYMLVRIIYFSDGWVLSPLGAANRCVAGTEIGRTFYRSEVESEVERLRRADGFYHNISGRLRSRIVANLNRLTNPTGIGTDMESYADFRGLASMVESAYINVVKSGKEIEEFLYALRRDIDSWDEPSEPPLLLHDMALCTQIALPPKGKENVDPFAEWKINYEGPEIVAECELISSPATAESSPATPRPELPAVTPVDKCLRLCGLKWIGRINIVYDFFAWAADNKLIEGNDTEIARRLNEHFNSSASVDVIRDKLREVRKKPPHSKSYSVERGRQILDEISPEEE